MPRKISFFARLKRNIKAGIRARALHVAAALAPPPAVARRRKTSGRKRVPKRRRKAKASAKVESESERAGRRARSSPVSARRTAAPLRTAGRATQPPRRALPALIQSRAEVAWDEQRTAWDRTQSVAEWAAEWAMPGDTLVGRLERGISLEESLTGERPTSPGHRLPMITAKARMLTVNGVTRPLVEWARVAGLSVDALGKRIDHGWAPEKAVTAPRQATNRLRETRYRIRAGEPGSWSWHDLPYERDVHAQAFVRAHPDGATMAEVGAAMGIEVSWICEIEKGALKKLRMLVDDGEITEAELVAALDTLAAHAPDDFDPEAEPVRPERTQAERRAHRAAARRSSALSGRPMPAESPDEATEATLSAVEADDEEPQYERWQDVPDVRDDDANDRHDGEHAAEEDASDAVSGDAHAHPWRRANKKHLSPPHIGQIRRWAANSSRVPAEALEWE